MSKLEDHAPELLELVYGFLFNTYDSKDRELIWQRLSEIDPHYLSPQRYLKEKKKEYTE